MSGRGEVGAGGGPAGDLYVEIVETAHETLMREGDNLHLALAVSMAAAAAVTVAYNCCICAGTNLVRL